MKIGKFKFVILIIFILGLFLIPNSVAIVEELGTDINNDLLQSNPETINSFETWLGDFYINEYESPLATDLFDIHTDWFTIVDGPGSVDVKSWGIAGDDVYIVVEDITDFIDITYFSIGIVVIYNGTTITGNTEYILWVAQINIYNGIIDSNEYLALFNEDESDEDNETGSVNINDITNTYKLEFNTDWMSETDTNTITNNLYGCIFGTRWNESFIGDVSEYNIDLFPNSYYGQPNEVEVSGTTLAITPVLFIIIVLSFFIVVFLVLYVSKYRTTRKSVKRNKPKKSRDYYKQKNITGILYYIIMMFVGIIMLLIILGVIETI